MAFSNVLQCQRDALAKGVEIIKRTLDKYDDVMEKEEEIKEENDEGGVQQPDAPVASFTES